jgi:hypothetical protein
MSYQKEDSNKDRQDKLYMRRIFFKSGLTICLLAIICAGEKAMAQQKNETASPAPPAANPKDVASMDAIIKALYDTISGPAGQQRDWNRLRSLFISGARLIPTGTRPTGEAGVRVLDVEAYIESSGPYLLKNGFFEREIARRTETFGNIAHVFSTYDSRHKADDAKPFSRGINSIQLLFDGTRWWVVTIFWDAERPDNPIPKKYLKSRKD